MIVIVPYQPTWPAEFRAIGQAIRGALGDSALRIDHIGSTSVPDLAAKNQIDVQISVKSLEPRIEAGLERIGYKRKKNVDRDHVPPRSTGEAGEWAKWFFEPAAGQRPANVHVRIAGRANQRYAVLFRDYLRTHPAAAQAYAQVKSALAKYHADDVDAYYAVKDPVCDIILAGAEEWAASNQWSFADSDC